MILDADSILNNTQGLLNFAQAAKTPVLYFDSEGAIWDKISAPFAFFPKSDVGLAFARESASFLARIFYGGENPGFWYVDQLALLGGFVKHSENVSLCPAHLCSDIECGDSAMFWTLSNDKQHKAYVKRTKQILKSAPTIK